MSMGSVVMSSVLFLILVICVISYFFLSLARSLLILLIFFSFLQNQILVLLIFLYFLFSVSLISALILISFVVFIWHLIYSFSQLPKVEIYLTIDLSFKKYAFCVINFLLSTVLLHPTNFVKLYFWLFSLFKVYLFLFLEFLHPMWGSNS